MIRMGSTKKSRTAKSITSKKFVSNHVGLDSAN